MSPIYEFVCVKCSDVVEEIRALGDYEGSDCSHCSTKRFKIVSSPNMHVWETAREFPNLRNEGDGKMSFDTKESYELHLKENGAAEWSTDAPIKTPHGNKTLYKHG